MQIELKWNYVCCFASILLIDMRDWKYSNLFYLDASVPQKVHSFWHCRKWGFCCRHDEKLSFHFCYSSKFGFPLYFSFSWRSLFPNWSEHRARYKSWHVIETTREEASTKKSTTKAIKHMQQWRGVVETAMVIYLAKMKKWLCSHSHYGRSMLIRCLHWRSAK